MNKTIKLYLIILGVLILVLGILEINKKPIINWSFNYDISQKSPFGLYIFNEEAESFFDNQLKKTTQLPYLYITKETPAWQNYLIIEKSVTKEGYKALLNQVKKGSNLFLATEDISRFIKDTLGINTLYYSLDKDTAEVHFKNKKIKNHFILDRYREVNLMKDTATAQQKPLAYTPLKDEVGVNLMAFKFGKGKVFIFTQPVLFTNYYLLKKHNADLVPYLFARMPKQETIWFQEDTSFISYSPLRFILKNKNLRHAWQIMIIALILFAIFNAKRRQRIMPIKEPNTNKSLEFVKSIGNLYLQEGNSKDMAHKKATYFLERVRNELYIPTDRLDESFAKKLRLKTGQSEETIKEALRLLQKAIHPKAPVKPEELAALNKILDKIYK